jgi:hypothetical protein
MGRRWVESDMRRYRAALECNGALRDVPPALHQREIQGVVTDAVTESVLATQQSRLVPYLGDQELLPTGVLFVVWCGENGRFWHGGAPQQRSLAMDAPPDLAAEVAGIGERWGGLDFGGQVAAYLGGMPLVAAMEAIGREYPACVPG